MIEELKKKAEKGCAISQYRLGLFHYFQPKAEDEDDRKAFLWFEKAAKQGNSESEYYLAVCYITGRGIQKNSEKAFEWYLKSAKKGFEEAQYQTGVLYLCGNGVKINYNEAYYWFCVASALDHSLAMDCKKMMFDCSLVSSQDKADIEKSVYDDYNSNTF